MQTTTIDRVTFDTYTYLVSGERYWPTCRRCGGEGQTPFYWVDNGRCYDCGGRGTTARESMTEEQARTRAGQLNRSRDARIAKKENERLATLQKRAEARAAFEAKHGELCEALRQSSDGFLRRLQEALEQYGTLTEAQVAAGERAMAQARERFVKDAEKQLLGRPVGEPGDKVTVSGTIEQLTSIEGQYGTSRLVVLVTAERVTVKTFTTAGWAWEVDKGDTVTITGTVKKNEEYKGVTASVLTRCKLSQ